MAGTGRRGAVPGRGAAPRGCLVWLAHGTAPEVPHAMSPLERGPAEGSSSSLGVPPPPPARSLTMLVSTLRHCHGNPSSRLCWRCLHQRPQQGRIPPKNASPTQASITQGEGSPSWGQGSGPLPARCSGDSALVPAPTLKEWLSSSVGQGTGGEGWRGAAAHRLQAGSTRRSSEWPQRWPQHRSPSLSLPHPSCFCAVTV